MRKPHCAGWIKRAKPMNPRHCLSAHPLNPPFQPTREDVWLIFLPPFARAAERGR